MNTEALPRWLARFLTLEEMAKVSLAVVKAERKTSAEIVPMVVRSSIDQTQVSWKLFALFLSIFFLFEPAILFSRETLLSPYETYLTLVGELMVLFFSAFLLSKIDWVCRLMTSERALKQAVWAHAELEFHRLGVTKTQARNGILLFVSVLEHRAVVLADEKLCQALDPSTWDGLLTDLLVEIGKGQMAKGFDNAIEHAAEIAKNVSPPVPHDIDELSNRLRIKDAFYV